jgi:ABC-type Fe3+-siderophore transport system permease subunit
MAAVSTAPVHFYAFYVLLIVQFILWQVMFFALHERMQNKAPQLTRIAVIAASAGTALAVTFAVMQAETIRKIVQHIVPMQDAAYRVFREISGGLALPALHFYGWAGLMIGCAIVRTRPFSVIPGWLLVGAGLLEICDFLYAWLHLPNIGAVGHLIDCIAAVWIGIALLRQKQPQRALEEMAASK